MPPVRRALASCVLLALCSTGVAGFVPVRVQDVTATPAVFTPQEMEALLLKGRITNPRGTVRGITGAQRVTLTDGQRTHDAQVQDINTFGKVVDVGARGIQLNFRDTYRYNIAAYRLARLLGLDNVPMSVPRNVDGKPAAMTWWIDDVAMDESVRRRATDTMGPDPDRTNAYLHILRVFDELIQNTDRNSGNLLWTRDWTMWMIDHTRAFRTDPKLLNPSILERCERNLFAALKTLTRGTLMRAVGDSLLEPEADAVLSRRSALVRLFDDRIAKLGEEQVLYTLAR